MATFGIVKFSLRERINTKGVRFVSFPCGSLSVVNTKSKSKIDRWAKVSNTGELMELLGPVGNKSSESKVLHLSLGISPCKYPSYTIKPPKLNNSTDEIINTVFSVDHETTKDIDDALSVSRFGRTSIIGIHITDVADTLYNRLNEDDRNTLFSFAMKRSSSTYTSDGSTPMLPPYLTYNELSLSQGNVRKSITLWVTFDNDTKNIVHSRFENCLVLNKSATSYDCFIEKHPDEYSILSHLSGFTEPTDIISWTMLMYNKHFALLDKDILLRHQCGSDMAQYSFSCDKRIHDAIGCLYTHATSPIRRYADLYNQMCWHGYSSELDLETLNVESANVSKFHRRHSVLDLSYACREKPQKVRILPDKGRSDTVRVEHGHDMYTVPRFDTFYEGELVPNTECYIWGILKNGISTLRIQTNDLENNIIPYDNSHIIEETEQVERDTCTKEDVEDILGHQLDEFQTNCYQVISNGDDLFGVAPTGSGKTGVAMTAIHNAFHNNTRAIYTSPIKSLSNEKYGDFSKKLDNRVSLLTGDIKLRCSPPGGDGASELIIMTAEILRNKLFSKVPDPDLKNVSVVIIDECHYINDTERGTVWEETFMMLPKHIKIVALSATLDKPDIFCGWLNNRRPTKLVQRFDRHVPLYFGTVEGKELKLMNNKDSKTYVWDTEHYKPSYAKLTRSLIDLDLCPAIIFCMGRKKCVMAAESITDNLVLPRRPFKPKENASDAEHDAYELELTEYNNHVVEYKRKFDSLKKKYLGKFRKQLDGIPGYEDFMTMLQKGVAYHHAAMIPILREFVEVLFREKLIMAVFATETLGCGIDMPARTVVFTELEKPNGENGRRLLRTEEFMQMAGRAGRRGRDVKGYVLYYSPKNEKVPYSTFAGLALGRPPKATSQLQITPDLVLRNYSNGYESMKNSLYSSELSNETSHVSAEYDSIVNKFEPDILQRILHLDDKLAGNGFIKLTPKQSKQVKNELKSLLGGRDIEDARHQWYLYDTIRHCTSTIDTLWYRCVDVLKHNEFVDVTGKMTRVGVIASYMSDGMPMVRAHILDKYLNMDIDTMISWLSIFAGGPSININKSMFLHPMLKDITYESVELADKYYDTKLNSTIAYIVYDWVLYRDISRILQYTDISSFGSFIKVILRVSSFIEEIKSILLGLEHYEQYNKLENYEERLFFGLVGNDSIHI